MVRSAVAALEAHHRVRIQASALEAAVKLSYRYLPERQLPDKAMSLLDTACASARLRQVTPPPTLLELRERVACLSSGLHLAQQEETRDNLGELSWDALRGQLKATTAELASHEAQWQSQSRFEQEVRVSGEHVAEVLQTWTGIPLTTLRQDAIASVMNLETRLAGRIFGQPQAMKAIARRIQTVHAGLEQPEKPVGVFLLMGPSGVGKTETALALAELLYGGEQLLITINMSEYQEAHSVALLKGAPPGYVGYGEGGVLTESVRRRPHSVVLLDEIEKAHPDVHELFFQVFDKGRMEDAEGNLIDFRNTLILMTSNVGSTLISQHAGREETEEGIHEALQAELLRVFPAAFIGRLITVPFLPLDESMLRAIIHERLARIRERVQRRYQIAIHYDPDLVDDLVRRSRQSSSGGRRVDALLTQDLLPTLSLHLLAQQRDNVAASACCLRMENNRVVVDVMSDHKTSITEI